MKAGTRDSSQPPTTAEDEALKRNTDCVYFLASPLTCKKGSECEYRHSENARINPRDCWYWLSGNCLNPKCSFRHPPLDGLLGTPGATSVGSSLPPPQTAPSTPLPAPSTQLPAAHTPAYNSGKQAIPCFYFQKGQCLKGDRCPFVHGPQPIDNLVQQPVVPKVAVSVTETRTLKKDLGGLEKCIQQQKIPQLNIIKPVEVPPPAKPHTKSEPAASKNGIAVKKTMPPPTLLDHDFPRYKQTNVPPVIGGNSASRTHRGRQVQSLDERSFQNGKEPDEFLGESSPGFDVLVDDDLRDSDYYHTEDEFGGMTVHEGRHLNSVNEFDYSHSADYGSLAKFDREQYNDPRGYPYGPVQDQYAWEQRRASSERISERSSVPERRGFSRAESPDQIVGSDLRHRLSKQRKVNGSRSAVSPDHRGSFYRRDDHDRRVEEQRYRGRSPRDSRHLHPHESSISNRLQGRITLPGRSSPDSDHNDSRPERKMDRGRNWRKLSPGRLPTSSYQGRLQDRLKRRVQEDLTTEERTSSGPPIRREEVDNTLNFAGPKSLAELKGAKGSESSEEQRAKGEQVFSLGEQKNTKIGKLVDHQESEGSISFEGPKPLSAILKRKRGAESASSGNGTSSGYGEESNQRERVEDPIYGSRMMAVAEKQINLPSEPGKEATHHALGSTGKPKFTTTDTTRTVDEDAEEEEEGLITTEGDEVAHVDQSSAQKESEHEKEDMMMMDAVDDQELETFDQRDGESDYEQVDGGDFKIEEDENANPEEEYLDDDDGDDFAKRIGVMFS